MKGFRLVVVGAFSFRWLTDRSWVERNETQLLCWACYGRKQPTEYRWANHEQE